MYTFVLLLLSIFSLYIGAWAFIRWDASWLRNLNLVPVKILLIVIAVLFLMGALFLIYRLLKGFKEQALGSSALICMIILVTGQLAGNYIMYFIFYFSSLWILCRHNFSSSPVCCAMIP